MSNSLWPLINREILPLLRSYQGTMIYLYYMSCVKQNWQNTRGRRSLQDLKQFH